MKLFHSLIYPLLGGLLCLSCSDDEQDAGTKQPAITGEVTFGVDLTGFSTRVTQDGSSWNNGDKIGAYVLDMKTLEPATEAANVPYVCSEEGASVSFASTTPLKVQNDGIPVKFVAYYPYNADIRDWQLKKGGVPLVTYCMLPRTRNILMPRRTNLISHSTLAIVWLK